jgi:hypothetical protein
VRPLLGFPPRQGIDEGLYGARASFCPRSRCCFAAREAIEASVPPPTSAAPARPVSASPLYPVSARMSVTPQEPISSRAGQRPGGGGWKAHNSVSKSIPRPAAFAAPAGAFARRGPGQGLPADAPIGTAPAPNLVVAAGSGG